MLEKVRLGLNKLDLNLEGAPPFSQLPIWLPAGVAIESSDHLPVVDVIP